MIGRRPPASHLVEGRADVVEQRRWRGICHGGTTEVDMPGQGRKRAGDDVAPVIEGEIVPATLEDLDEPAGREGDDELDDDAVEMSEADEEDEEDEDEEDEDEDADADEAEDADEADDDEDDDEDDEDE